MEVTATVHVSGNWEHDFEIVQQHLEPSKPCYVIYRTDETSPLGTFLFLFFCHVPDTAKVREKMLYASTRATLTKELGDSMFKDQYYGNKMDDFSLKGYQKHCQSQAAAVPLTAREAELETIKLAENGADISVSSKRAHVSGLSVCVDDAVAQCLQQWKDPSPVGAGISKALFLMLDLDRDNMLILAPEKQDASTLASLPSNDPRYILIGAQQLTLFVYYCPGTAVVRQRMIYASSRANVVSYLENATQIIVDRKLETSDGADLTWDALQKELGLFVADNKPSDSTVKHGFIRKGVAGPGAGPRRLVK